MSKGAETVGREENLSSTEAGTLSNGNSDTIIPECTSLCLIIGDQNKAAIEKSDCNLVHQTPKLPAIISSFLHQTQAYTDSQANPSCNTWEREIQRKAQF